MSAPILAAAVSEGVHLLPWVIGLMITLGVAALTQLAHTIWFASRINTRLDHTVADVESMDRRLVSIESEIKGLRRDLSDRDLHQAERIARIEGKLNGLR
jgi:hypothetical protein